MTNILRHFRADTGGNIAVTSAILLTVLVGGMAIAVDLGTIFLDRRKAQITTDLAAISAASNLSSASAAATATLQTNAYPANTPLSVQLGIYTADSSIAPASRFAPSSAAAANAARVTLSSTTPLYFAKLLLGTNQVTVTTTATATNTALASFAIGSRLLSLNGGLENQILGQMLGSNLSLSLMDYQSLISANVDLFDFMGALATRANITGPTYNSVLNSSVKVGTVFSALLDSERNTYGYNSAAANAILQFVNSATNSAVNIPVGSLLNLGPYANLTLGQKPQASASVDALDLVTAMAQLANGVNQVAVALNLGIPGLANVNLNLAIGQPPVGTSWVSVGSVGASVHTAQTRLLLQVQITGGAIPLVNLPLYVEVASGTAVLTAATCSYPTIANSTVSLGVTPGIVDAWIGNVSMSDFNNLRSAPNPGPATLVNVLGLAQVTGKAHLSISNLSAKTVNFSYADIQAQTRKTVSTTSFVGSLVTSLLGNTTITINVLGLGLPVPLSADPVLAGILNTVAAPLDQALTNILATLGIGLGQADVWVSGLRCDGAVLVN